MNKKNQDHDSSESFVLDENLEISDAGTLLVELQAIVENNSSAVIDGSQIKVVDTAILQLLVAVFRQAQQHEFQITWQQPSDALYKTAALLGLESDLCLPAAVT